MELVVAGQIKSVRNSLITALRNVVLISDGVRPNQRAVASKCNDAVSTREDDFHFAVAIEIIERRRSVHFGGTAGVGKAGYMSAVPLKRVNEPLAIVVPGWDNNLESSVGVQITNSNGS